MSDQRRDNPPEPPRSEMILYQTADGRTRIECRFEDETIWLPQRLIAELFDIGVNTVNHHLKELFDDGELGREATIRSYRIVQTEGARQVARDIRASEKRVYLRVREILAPAADSSLAEAI